MKFAVVMGRVIVKFGVVRGVAMGRRCVENKQISNRKLVKCNSS